MQLSSKVEAIKPSPTLALNAKARALVSQGVDVVSFAAGEPDFDTPEHIKQAARVALEKGYTKYTPTGGIPELKAAIVAKLWADQQLKYGPEQVLVSCGAKHSLFNLFQALLEPGDEVLILAPYWVSYPDMVTLAGGRPVILQTRAEDGYVPAPDVLRRALGERTRAIVINSPSNPTGAVLGPAQLKSIAEVLRGHDCLVISDDIYEKLIYGGQKFCNIAQVEPALAERTVVVNGCSKAYSMTGWRIGYTAGPAQLIAAMQKVQDQSTSNPTSISQYAAVAALTGPTAPLEAMVREFELRKRALVDGLNALRGIRCQDPEGAFYVFPDLRGLFGKTYQGKLLTSSAQVADILLSDFRVAAVPGAPFGAEGFLRLSFATSMQNITQGLERIAAFVKTLA